MSKMIAIYEKLTGDEILPDDPRRADIIAEILAVRQAKTEAAARVFIDWWGWDSQAQLTRFIRKVRKEP